MVLERKNTHKKYVIREKNSNGILRARLQDVRRMLRAQSELELSDAAVQRLKWFAFALEHGGNVSLTCRHFAIARSTFVRWAERFDGKNPLSLEDYSRCPHTVRQTQTDAGAVELIRRIRTDHPVMGKVQVQRVLREQHGVSLSVSAVGRVIERHGFFFADTPSHRAKRQVLSGGSDDASFMNYQTEKQAVPSVESQTQPSLFPPPSSLPGLPS